MTYSLIDSGNECKLEQFGDFMMVRPCPQAIWSPALPKTKWDAADASFSREDGNKWTRNRKLPSAWTIKVDGLTFKIAPTDFGHLGIFPEHLALCRWMAGLIKTRKSAPNILNLFAYSGAATLAAAKAGAQVCHLDASKGMVAWARENAALSGLEKAPIRWIVDDVIKFLKREARRGVTYDGIICDPPTFGRGSAGQVFKIERDLTTLLNLCQGVLSKDPLFMILSCHTPGITPLVLKRMLEGRFKGGKIEEMEMVIPSETNGDLPCGSVARWS